MIVEYEVQNPSSHSGLALAGQEPTTLTWVPLKTLPFFCINSVMVIGSRISIDSVDTALVVFPSYVTSPKHPTLP